MSKHTNRRILIIDDNPAIHEDFRKILCAVDDDVDHAEAEFFGRPAPAPLRPIFEIDSAHQGEEGVAALCRALEEGRPYAMAFVDVRMPPGIDGVETAELLWQLCPELQVVICTAHSDYSWHRMISRLCNRDRLLVLKKPFAALEALQLACALCEKWELTQEACDRLADTEKAVAERTRELLDTNERLQTEIEQRKEAEAHLLRAQRLESIGTLASGIAHDINNMLAPILMAADLLRLQMPDKSQELLSLIENSAGRAAGVVKQVLTFARGIEGKRLPIAPKDLINEMKKIIFETFPRLIDLQCSIPQYLPLIEGDPTQLNQVLLNLSVNARDAMPDGGTLSLHVDEFQVDEHYATMTPGARIGDYVRIRVSDTGTGIQRNLIEKIFDPFFTTKPLGKGTGLGLSTVVGIIKSHEGFLDVKTELGKGTTFEVFLPIALRGAPLEAPAREATIPPGRGELVLVVDDESAVRNVTETVLSEHGYRTLAAADGAEALSIFARHRDRIAVVFTDMMMPVVDGMALCRALRKMDPTVRIIAATGSEEENGHQDVNSLNIGPLLNKPFTTGALLTRLNETLANKHCHSNS